MIDDSLLPFEYHERLAGLYWVWDDGRNDPASLEWAAGPIPPYMDEEGHWRRPRYEDSVERWKKIQNSL